MYYVRCIHVVGAHHALSTVARSLHDFRLLFSPTWLATGGVMFATDFTYGASYTVVVGWGRATGISCVFPVPSVL